MSNHERNTAAYAEIFNKKFAKEAAQLIAAMICYYHLMLGVCFLITEIGVSL